MMDHISYAKFKVPTCQKSYTMSLTACRLPQLTQIIMSYSLLVCRLTTCTVQSKHTIPCLSPVTQNKKRSHAPTTVKTLRALMRQCSRSWPLASRVESVYGLQQWDGRSRGWNSSPDRGKIFLLSRETRRFLGPIEPSIQQLT